MGDVERENSGTAKAVLSEEHSSVDIFVVYFTGDVCRRLLFSCVEFHILRKDEARF